MRAAGGGPANQQGNFQHAEVRVTLHFFGHMRHLFQRWRNQSRQTDDVSVLCLGFGKNFGAGHHHAHVHNFEVITLQNHRYNVLANVVDITLDRGNDDLALGFGRHTGTLFLCQFFFFDVGHQMGDRLLHHAGRFYDLRQEHFALTKQIANDIHAIHQRTFDHMNRTSAIAFDLRARFLGVFDDPLRNAVNQCVGEALFNRRIAPDKILFFFFVTRLERRGQFDHALGCVRPAIEHHVFGTFTQFGREIVIHTDHASIDNTHGHAGANRVIQKDRVNRFTRRIIAAEREAHIRHAAADFGVR